MAAPQVIRESVSRTLSGLMNRTLFRAPVLTSMVIASAILLTTYPFFHNRYIFPLGRLYGSIAEGQACSDVYSRFAEYRDARRGASEVQFTNTPTTTDLLRTQSVPPGRILLLYDLSLFDDIQLSVRCDRLDRVAEILFIGD